MTIEPYVLVVLTTLSSGAINADKQGEFPNLKACQYEVRVLMREHVQSKVFACLKKDSN